MSDISEGEGWWIASDGKWYPPESHPDFVQPNAAQQQAPGSDGWSFDQRSAAEHQEEGASRAASAEALEPKSSTETLGSSKGFGKWLPFAVVGLVVLAGAGFLVTSVLGDDGDATGASSAESAFNELVDAVNDEDVLGMATLLDPAELGFVADAIRDASDAGADLTGLPGGLDLTLAALDGGELTADFSPLGGEDSGLVVVSIPEARLAIERTDADPFGYVVYDQYSLQAFTTADIRPGSVAAIDIRKSGSGFEATASAMINGTDFGPSSEFSDLPLEIVFIEDGDKWYFSASYTIANLAVASGAVPEPDYGAWRKVLASDESGGDTPIEAVKRLANSIPAQNLDELFISLDPIEARLLHDFLPVISAEADAALDQALTDDEVSITIEELELAEEIDGDTAKVTLKSIRLRLSDGFNDSVFELDNRWCYRFEDTWSGTSGCVPRELERLERELQYELDGLGGVVGFGTDVSLSELLPDEPFVTATRRGGNWYVSPLATVLGYGEHFQSAFGDPLSALDFRGLGAGAVPGESLPTEGSRDFSIGAGEVLGVIVSPDGDFPESEFRDSLLASAVTITADAPIDIRHEVAGYFGYDDSGSPGLRLAADEPRTIVVAFQDRGSTVSQGLIIENDRGETVNLTFDVQPLPVINRSVAEGSIAANGVIDDEGTPWVVVGGDAVVEGADVIHPSSESFPWFEMIDSPGESIGLVIVQGAPGTAFTVRFG